MRLLDIPQSEALSCETPVVFRSETGSASDVTIVNSSIQDYTLHLNGADGLTFEDLTIQTVHATYHAVVIDNEANCNTFSGCVFEGAIVNTTATTRAVVYSPSSNDTANVFIGNTFRNGSYNLYISGDESPGTIVTGNTMEDAYFRGAYINEQLGLHFNDNTVTSLSSYGSYQGVFLNSCGPGLRVVGKLDLASRAKLFVIADQFICGHIG